MLLGSQWEQVDIQILPHLDFPVLDWQTMSVCTFVCVCTHTWASQMVLEVKNPPTNAGDIRHLGLIPGSGRSPGGGHGNLLQYSCLENPTNRGAWRATVHGVSKNQTWLSTTHSTSWLYQFTFPPTVQEGLLFSTSSPAFIVCRCFGDGLSDRCAVITLCSFDFSFL